MKKYFFLLLAIFVMAGATDAISFNRIIYPIKTKDTSDYVLMQYQAPQRIVSASPAVTEILFALNLQDRIVGVTENCDWPEEALPAGRQAKKIEKVGRDKLNKDKVLKLQPDLVIVPLEGYRSELEGLRKIKFTVSSSTETNDVTLEVFAVDPKNLSDVFQTISVIGTITNREHAAYSILQRMKRRIDWVTARAMKEKRMKAVVLVSKRPITVAGEGILYDLTRAAGFVSVLSRGQNTKMKREEIAKANPDIIITNTDVARNPKDIYNNRNFRKTNAGKNKKAVCVDKNLLRPGPRIPEALEQIAEQAYGWPPRGEGREIEQIKE